jgi:hypothetical protein
LVNCKQLLCTETWRHSKLARRSCKIRREKHPRAFVKVVEGSEIYNFPIHHFVHFYSKFGRKSRSNRGTVKQIAAGTRHCASQCAGRARARRTAASVSGPARAFPRPPLPEVPHSLRSLTRPEQRWSPRPRVSSAHTCRAGPMPAAATGSPCHAACSLAPSCASRCRPMPRAPL